MWLLDNISVAWYVTIIAHVCMKMYLQNTSKQTCIWGISNEHQKYLSNNDLMEKEKTVQFHSIFIKIHMYF